MQKTFMSLSKAGFLKRLLIAFAIGGAPTVLGISALYLEAASLLDDKVNSAVSEALAELNGVLDIAEASIKESQPLVGMSCNDAQFALRKNAASKLYVRSISLTIADTIYCSSVFGDFHEQIMPEEFARGSIRLLAGNKITPDSPVLYYRSGPEEKGVLSVIDGRYLSDTLKYVDPKANLSLQVGDHWLNASGKVFDGVPESFPVASKEIVSKLYPVSISGGMPAGSIIDYVFIEFQGLLILFSSFGLGLGVVSYWLLRRVPSLRHDFSRAIREREIIPYVQPLVSNSTGRWEGVEVLARWNHPRDGLVPPNVFIPFAEHSGLVIDMTRSLMSQVADELSSLAENLAYEFHIAFNISEKHFHGLGLIEDCKLFLSSFAPGAVTLVLEITERELITPTEEIYGIFSALDSMGVKISLDDFGTGHSSLDYVRKFKVDYLKIDQSFISMVGEDVLAVHLLENIIDLAERIDLKVVAEGVQTLEQREYLRGRDIDLLQGYLFSRPIALKDFAEKMLELRVSQP